MGTRHQIRKAALVREGHNPDIISVPYFDKGNDVPDSMPKRVRRATKPECLADKVRHKKRKGVMACCNLEHEMVVRFLCETEWT